MPSTTSRVRAERHELRCVEKAPLLKRNAQVYVDYLHAHAKPRLTCAAQLKCLSTASQSPCNLQPDITASICLWLAEIPTSADFLSMRMFWEWRSPSPMR